MGTQMIPSSAEHYLPGSANPYWLPPRETIEFVQDVIELQFGRTVSNFNPHWIPACIVSTLDWIRLSGWWPFIYSSTFHSEEEFHTIWRFRKNGSWEMDPKNMKIYRDDAHRSSYEQRRKDPRLTIIEKSEVLRFIRKVVFSQLNIPDPGAQVATEAAYATLMWVLSPYGKEWLYEQDPIISSAQDYGIAFLHCINKEPPPQVQKLRDMVESECTIFTLESGGVQCLYRALKYLEYLGDEDDYVPAALTQEMVDAMFKFQAEENLPSVPDITYGFIDALEQAIASTDLIDPMQMENTERPVGTCSSCGSELWCVRPYHIVADYEVNNKQQSLFGGPAKVEGTSQGHNYLCNTCSSEMAKHLDVFDYVEDSIDNPKCHGCTYTKCPHVKVVEDEFGRTIPQRWIDMGRERVDTYVHYLSAQPKNQYGGLTAEELTSHFNGNQLTTEV